MPAATATSTQAGPIRRPDPLEPLRVGQAAAQMALKHVVVTSGRPRRRPRPARATSQTTIRAIKLKLPEASVEVLTTFSASRRRRSAPFWRRSPRSSTTTSKPSAGCTGTCAAPRRATTRRSGCSPGRRSCGLPGPDQVGDHRRPGRDERRGRRDDARPAPARRRRRHDRPVPQPSPKHAQIDRWVHPDEFRWLREQG